MLWNTGRTLHCLPVPYSSENVPTVLRVCTLQSWVADNATPLIIGSINNWKFQLVRWALILVFSRLGPPCICALQFTVVSSHVVSHSRVFRRPTWRWTCFAIPEVRVLNVRKTGLFLGPSDDIILLHYERKYIHTFVRKCRKYFLDFAVVNC